MKNSVDATYIFTPIIQIHDMIQKDESENYCLFEKNVREYLGCKGINGKIADTLKNPEERVNFFNYNNGITIICDEVKNEQDTNRISNELNQKYVVKNPQIVNGCQTVSTIHEVLSKYHTNDNIKEEFKDTFVVVKLLKLSATDEKQSNLYKNIVKYNNSQNSINEKDFAANQTEFETLQKELRKLGFLLAIKQSDKNKFKDQKISDFRPLLVKYEELFGLKFNKITDIIIPLDKLLQVILAFDQNGHKAFIEKGKVLKLGSITNSTIIQFIKDAKCTNKNLLNIYLMFLKAEREKKASEDKRTPIPYYLIGFIGNKFNELMPSKYNEAFEFIFKNKESIDNIYNFYKLITKKYHKTYQRNYSIEYNQMVKKGIDVDILSNSIEDALDESENTVLQSTIKKFKSM